MKLTALLAALLFFTGTHAQCGVYLTAADYLNNKLTDEGKTLRIPSGPGEDDRLVIATANGSKTYLFTEIWGYKNLFSEYRFIKGKRYLIACRGEIFVFTPYGPVWQKREKIIYYRTREGFGEINISKNVNDPEPATLNDYADLWALFDAETVKKLKEFYTRKLTDNEGVDVVPEQLIDYYNSTRPGYVKPAYTHIEIRTFSN